MSWLPPLSTNGAFLKFFAGVCPTVLALLPAQVRYGKGPTAESKNYGSSATVTLFRKIRWPLLACWWNFPLFKQCFCILFKIYLSLVSTHVQNVFLEKLKMAKCRPCPKKLKIGI